MKATKCLSYKPVASEVPQNGLVSEYNGQWSAAHFSRLLFVSYAITV